MSGRPRFNTLYYEELRPLLVQLEKRRLRIARNLAILIGAVSGIALTGLILWPGFEFESLYFVGLLAALMIGLGWWLLTRDFVSDFKHSIIRRIIQFSDGNLIYRPEFHISKETFQSSQIFKHRIDRFRGEDHVRGQIGKTRIEFSEIHAEYKTQSRSRGRSRTDWHTIFKGLYFTADFNKHFRGVTVVLPDVAEKLFGRLGQSLQSWNLNREPLVKLEDPEFEKLFVVYSTDQVEARYILSTSLMRRIVDFKRRSGLPLYLSFSGSRIHIAMTTGRDLFEPRIFGTLLDFEAMRRYFEDVQMAIGIVDELNLNTRIWTKE